MPDVSLIPALILIAPLICMILFYGVYLLYCVTRLAMDIIRLIILELKN